MLSLFAFAVCAESVYEPGEFGVIFTDEDLQKMLDANEAAELAAMGDLTKMKSMSSAESSQVSMDWTPDEWNWADLGVVSAVKNQAYCGSCVIFGVSAAMESRNAVKNSLHAFEVTGATGGSAYVNGIYYQISDRRWMSSNGATITYMDPAVTPDDAYVGGINVGDDSPKWILARPNNNHISYWMDIDTETLPVGQWSGSRWPRSDGYVTILPKNTDRFYEVKGAGGGSHVINGWYQKTSEWEWTNSNGAKLFRGEQSSTDPASQRWILARANKGDWSDSPDNPMILPGTTYSYWMDADLERVPVGQWSGSRWSQSDGYVTIEEHHLVVGLEDSEEISEKYLHDCLDKLNAATGAQSWPICERGTWVDRAVEQFGQGGYAGRMFHDIYGDVSMSYDGAENCPFDLDDDLRRSTPVESDPVRVGYYSGELRQYFVDSEALKQEIFSYGPCIISMRPTPGSGNPTRFGSGVFKCHSSDENGHAMAIVGFGKWTENNEERDYWLVKNSWGSSWGDNGGYVKIDIESCIGRIVVDCPQVKKYAAPFTVQADNEMCWSPTPGNRITLEDTVTNYECAEQAKANPECGSGFEHDSTGYCGCGTKGTFNDDCREFDHFHASNTVYNLVY